MTADAKRAEDIYTLGLVIGYMPQGPDGYIPDAEMFARWCQFGALSPIMRFHAKKDIFWYPQRTDGLAWDGGSRLPWSWGPTAEKSISESIRLRAALNPYIYSYMHLANTEGTPLCRGMYIDYPEADEAYAYNQYKFGDAFLVAPVTRPSGDGQHGSTPTGLWLPSGGWYDFFTGEYYEGGNSIERISDIFSFPLYVAAGSIVPTTVPGDYVDRPLDNVTINAYAFKSGSGESFFELYEDSGADFGYEKGEYRTSTIRYHASSEGQLIELSAASGDYPGALAERDVTICLKGIEKPSEVSLNGSATDDWLWDNGVLTLKVGKSSVNEKITVNFPGLSQFFDACLLASRLQCCQVWG